MMMNRRSFSATVLACATASLVSTRGSAANPYFSHESGASGL